MNCPKCSQPLEEGALFCENCGAKVEADAPASDAAPAAPAPAPAPAPQGTVKCPSCGTDNLPGAAFCANCGATLSGTPAPAPGFPANGAAAAAQGQKKPFPIQWLVLGGAAVAVCAAAIIGIVAIVNLVNSGKEVDRVGVAYIKDQDLYTPVPGEKEGFQVTSNLAGSDSDAYEIAASYTQIDKNHQVVFFADNASSTSYRYGQTIYYRPLNNPEGEKQKMASDVVLYVLNDSATSVLYYDTEQDLYRYTLSNQEKVKIGKGVDSITVSDDCNTALYIDTENNLRLVPADVTAAADAIKLDKDVYTAFKTDKNLQTIYYLKSDDSSETDNDLYRTNAQGERTKIDADVSRVVCTYESGEMYYLKKNRDKEATNPYSLYYYNGTDTAPVSENVLSAEANATDAPLVVYAYVTEDKDTGFAAAAKGAYKTLVEFSKDEVNESYYHTPEFTVSEDGSKIFYTVTESREDYKDDVCTVYLATNNNGEIGDPVSYDTEVSDNYSVTIDKQNNVAYRKKVDSDNYALYFNQEQVAEYVQSYQIRNGRVLYSIYDSGDESLQLYENGNSQELSTDFESFLLLDNGEVYFLEDYSSGEGTLYLFRNGEKIKLDDEVYTIFRYNTMFESIPRSISG